MGRYAFFNTELEHKFAFGIQPSSDITEFGGTGDYNGNHTWTSEDIPFVQQELRDLELWLEIEPFDFTKYEKNLEGTQTLRYELEEKINKMDGVIQSKYVLGCLIYHQLLYTEKLTVHYEL